MEVMFDPNQGLAIVPQDGIESYFLQNFFKEDEANCVVQSVEGTKILFIYPIDMKRPSFNFPTKEGMTLEEIDKMCGELDEV